MRKSAHQLRESPITLRVSADLLRRAERLLGEIATDSAIVAMGRLTRSQVLRLALFEGIKVLEDRYGTAPDDRDRSSARE
jgi:hypothetical protein